MPICKRSIPVACRPEDAFEYVAEWSNFKNFMPMYLDIKPVSLVHYGPGLSLEMTFMIAKTEMSTTLDLVEFVKNQRLVFKASRGLKSKITWEFKALGDKTLLTFSFEYDVPQGLVLRDSQREGFEKEIEGNANQSLELLKWILETQAASQKA